MALIECVPNFSEGYDAARLDAIVSAIERPGVSVLDRSMDGDHNRSVVTLVGEPEALLEAMLAGIGKAAELIDLNRHRGVHPRIGATDVVPFIPVSGATLEDCVQLAHELGRHVWESYEIPVYFYEAAASCPERVRLEEVRRGQFELLRGDIKTVPARRPDVGEPRCHPTAGAIAIGARGFLVAYNIYLDSSDEEAARKIARAVRTSGGGLPAVKAMGLLVGGRAQVSMNLTDTATTSIAAVFEAVRREASRLGVEVASSEVIGLVPRRALEEAAGELLRIEHFSPAMVLENRLAAAGLSAVALEEPSRAAIERAVAHLESFLRSADTSPGPAALGDIRAALASLQLLVQSKR
jgi:glutamate formiminotransferase